MFNNMKKIVAALIFSTLTIPILAQTSQKTKAAGNQANSNTAKKVVVPDGNSLLYGIFSAPAGTAIVLQNNSKNDLTLTTRKETGKTYSTNTFNFPIPLLDGAKFKVTLKKITPGQTAGIYAGADGLMPQPDNKLRVGCDFTYDLVCRSSNDGSFSTFYESSDPSVGGNTGEEGRYVTFVSSAVGFAGATGKHRQIFWRDRNTGVTKLISAGTGGEEGNGDSYAPAISGDGKAVAFESYSTNLIVNDKNGLRDIFVWHSNTNKMERVSIGEGGKEANGESYEPSVSGDGDLIAFTSTASNISETGKGISNNNVFLRDMKLERSMMISVDPVAKKGGGGSRPSISYDGTRIAFYSNTATLVADDNNGIWDIFLWDKSNAKLKRVSLTADGKERSQGNESANRIVSPAISGNGRYIAFTTTAPNMVPGDINSYQDVFVYDINTSNTVIASNGANGIPGNADSPIEQGEKIAISFDGKWVAFSTKASNLGVPAANVVMHNMATGESRAVSAVVGSSVGRPSISYTGAYIVFGIGGKLDSRFPASGIFANYTGVGPCRFCPE
jgi:Tol biopolymer transport system component